MKPQVTYRWRRHCYTARKGKWKRCPFTRPKTLKTTKHSLFWSPVTSQELQQAFMSPAIAQRGNRGPKKAVPMPKNQWRTNLHKE